MARPGPLEETHRSRFLARLFADLEAETLAPLQDYLGEFADVEGFVREEYAALVEGADRVLEVPLRYEHGPLIARGGMGEVMLARDRVLGREVALKTLRGAGIDPRAMARLRREARVLGRLDHPAICRILDVLDQDGRITLVLPYHRGESLADRLDRARTFAGAGWLDVGPSGLEAPRNPQALSTLLGFVATVAEAVHTAHLAGIVHRDLKPGNLLVTADGSPVVLDFGIALEDGEVGQRLTATGEQLGTPFYMAPEQVDGGVCDARTDVHALGVVLYELLTLRRPFAGPTPEATFLAIRSHRFPLPRQHEPGIPRDLEAVCLCAMAETAERRYASAAEFAADLRRVQRLQPTLARPASGARRLLQLLRRHRARAALVMTALSALVMALLLLLDMREETRARELVADLLRDRAIGEVRALAETLGEQKPAVQVLHDYVDGVLRPVRLRFASPAAVARSFLLFGDDTAGPRLLVLAAYECLLELPPLTPGRTYRLGDQGTATSGLPMEFLAELPLADATVARSASDDPRGLERACQRLRAGQPRAALRVVEGVDRAELDGPWLQYLHAIVRLHCLESLGVVGSAADAARAEATRLHIDGGLERVHELRRRADQWSADTAEGRRLVAIGGRWDEVRSSLAELQELFPIETPLGVWARFTVARDHLSVLFDPQTALDLMDEVVQTLEQGRVTEWPDDVRRKLVRSMLAPSMPERPLAGTREDAMGQALLLRGYIRNQLGSWQAAIADLEKALPLFEQTGCETRVANTCQELAEALEMSGDPAFVVHRERARRKFEEPAIRDRTGLVSLDRSHAHALRRRGRFADAAPLYERFLVAWTGSDDPLRVEGVSLRSFDYPLTGSWLAECLLRQEDPAAQALGAQWVDRVRREVDHAGVEHVGVRLRLALLDAVLLWRSDGRERSLRAVEGALQDPALVTRANERADLAQFHAFLEGLR